MDISQSTTDLNLGFLDDNIDKNEDVTFNPILDSNYQIFLNVFDDYLQKVALTCTTVHTNTPIKNRILKLYIDKFNEANSDILSTQDELNKELFLLYQFSNILMMYNNDVLHLTKQQFRQKIYYPNVIFILIRHLTKASEFFNRLLRVVYGAIKKNHSSLINLYENSIYTDKEQIINEILYIFLGSSFRSIDPLEINNSWAFYRTVFQNHFNYFFMSEQKIHSSWTSCLNMDDINQQIIPSIPSRESIYRDVLIEYQMSEMERNSEILAQIKYNYKIFKNAVITNELQNLFFSIVGNTAPEVYDKSNNEYKILLFYNILLNTNNNDFINEVKKLPIIYRLLKSVRLIKKGKDNTSDHYSVIRPEYLKTLLIEELRAPFSKNMRSGEGVHPILNKVVENFINSLLYGEYISLVTLTPVKIDKYSFVTQLQKFVSLCLDHINKKKIHNYMCEI